MAFRCLVIIIGFLLSDTVSAHNPLSARYNLKAEENSTLLSIYLSSDGLERAMIERYGEEKLVNMRADDFKMAIVTYIKDNIELEVNEERLELGKAAIKLNSHQTELQFVLPPLPEVINELYVSIPAFKENPNHQTLFAYSLHGHSGKIVLKRQNDFRGTITLNKENTDYLPFAGLGLVIFCGIAIFTLVKMKYMSI